MTAIHEVPQAGLYYDLGGGYVNAKHPKFAFGGKPAIGDAKVLADGAITAGTANFTSAGAGFTAADVGKTIKIRGAGAAGLSLLTTIFAYVSSSAVTLNALAGTTVTGAAFRYGTNSLPMVQAAMDYVMLNAGYKLGRVLLPGGPGLYLFDGSFYMGYGSGNFGSAMFEGEGMVYGGSPNYVGTAIITTRTDRMAINLQGLRCPQLRNLTILGELGTWIDSNSLGLTVPAIDDTVASNWNDPALGGAAMDNRHSTYAGIALDGYSGTAPSDPYPVGGLVGYGRNFSSDPHFENVYLEGFTTGVAIQPCDADGNGDYAVFDHIYMKKVKWGISIGNTQSRSVAPRDVKCGIYYTVLTNNQHGKQSGHFGGNIENLNAYDGLYLAQFGSFNAGPLKFTQPYMESAWKVMLITQTGTSSEPSYIFDNPNFKFNNQTDARTVPAAVFEGGNSGTVEVHGGTFSKFPSLVGVATPNVIFKGNPQFIPDSPRTNPYEKFASNLLCNGVATPRFRMSTPAEIKVAHWVLDTGVKGVNPGYTGLWQYGDRSVCIPIYANRVVAPGALATDNLFNPQASVPAAGATAGVVISKTSGGNTVTVSGLEITITFAARTDATFLLFGPLTGDAIIDDATGTVFFVRSRVGLVVIAVAQNNYKNGALISFSTTIGAMYVGNARIYTPNKPLFATVAAATAQVTAVGTDSGSAAFDPDIVDGDIAMVYLDVDAWTTNTPSAIMASHTQAGPTINFALGTGMRAGRRRFAFWARLGPANV